MSQELMLDKSSLIENYKRMNTLYSESTKRLIDKCQEIYEFYHNEFKKHPVLIGILAEKYRDEFFCYQYTYPEQIDSGQFNVSDDKIYVGYRDHANDIHQLARLSIKLLEDGVDWKRMILEEIQEYEDKYIVNPIVEATKNIKEPEISEERIKQILDRCNKSDNSVATMESIVNVIDIEPLEIANICKRALSEK